MALVKNLEPLEKKRPAVHGEVACTYSIIQNTDGSKILQLDTYGSPTREIKGKVSQSIQFDALSIQKLKSIIDSEF